jgi:hypothetical protein
MPMNSNLTSALSEFTKKSEFSKSGLAAEFSSEPPSHPSELNLITRARLRLARLIPFAFARVLMIFFIGVVGNLSLAVLRWCGQRDDRWLVSTPWLAGATARTH